jgi:YggT family protein
MSWFPVDRHNGIVKLIYGLTEPILAPIRRMMFKSPMGGAGMPIDFSPVIAGILLEVIRRVLFSVILGMQIGI